MVPKCPPKGCQMELKSSKMDPEWAPEGFKMDPNWMSNHAGTKVFGSKLESKKKIRPQVRSCNGSVKMGALAPIGASSIYIYIYK